MSWTKRSENGFLVATETVTLLAASTDVSTSVIDFLKPGKDFVVISNAAATNLSSDADVAVSVCDTSSGTFVLLKDDLETTIDAAAKSSIYDVSANGESPYYKLVVDPDGVEAATNTVKFVVIQAQ